MGRLAIHLRLRLPHCSQESGKEKDIVAQEEHDVELRWLQAIAPVVRTLYPFS